MDLRTIPLHGKFKSKSEKSKVVELFDGIRFPLFTHRKDIS